MTGPSSVSVTPGARQVRSRGRHMITASHDNSEALPEDPETIADADGGGQDTNSGSRKPPENEEVDSIKMSNREISSSAPSSPVSSSTSVVVAGDSERSSSANSSSEGEEEEESSDETQYPIYKPPSTKVLPERKTRGRRMRELMDESEAEFDQEFWGNERWEEEAGDEEWTTSDEDKYKDKFDSDFLESSVEEEEGEEAVDIDKELAKRERQEAAKKHKFDYTAVAARRLERKEKSTRVWSVLDPNWRLPGVQTAKRGVPTTQAQLMAMAAKTEEINSRLQLMSEQDAIEQRKFRKTTGAPEARTTGRISSWISWSSERKIEYEENRKSQKQREIERFMDPYERNLLFFIDLTKPKASTIPADLYCQASPVVPIQPVCAVTGKPNPRYRDPCTGKPFDSVAAFTALREPYLRESATQALKLLTAQASYLEMALAASTTGDHQPSTAVGTNGAEQTVEFDGGK